MVESRYNSISQNDKKALRQEFEGGRRVIFVKIHFTNHGVYARILIFYFSIF